MKLISVEVFVISLTILVSISFASIFVLLANAPAPVCAFWRLLISTSILATALAVKGGLGGVANVLRNPKYLVLTIASGTALATHFLLWMESLFYVSVAVSVTIVVSYPLFNLLIDYLLLKERLRITQVVALLTGFTAIALFMSPRVSGVRSIYGVVLALTGALAASAYFSIGRVLRRFEGTLEYAVTVYGVATAVLLTYNLVTSTDFIHYGIKSYMYFVLLAVVPMIGGHTLMNYLLKYMKSSTVTSIALGEPVGASILAYLILNQYVTPTQALLMTVVITSILIIVREEVRSGSNLP